jgi:hypothetical protein
MNDGALFTSLFSLSLSLYIYIYMQPADIQTGIQTAETDRTQKRKKEKKRLNIYQLISMGAIYRGVMRA